MKGLLDSPYHMNLILNGIGLLGSKYKDNAQRYHSGIQSSLLGIGKQKRQDKKDAREAENDRIRNELMQAQTQKILTPGAQNRKTVKGVDGRNYFVDTQEPVLPQLNNYEKPEDTEKLTDYEFKLRKEYNDQSKVFMDQSRAYKRIINSAQAPSAAGDLSLIFNYMKVLDPGSTVREGEFANAQNSGGIDSKVRSLYNSIINGQRLSHPQRADFVDRAGRLYQGATDMQGMTDQRYRSLAESNKLTPENILFNPGIEIYQYPQELLQSDPVEPRQKTKVIDGVTYIQKDGEWYAN